MCSTRQILARYIEGLNMRNYKNTKKQLFYLRLVKLLEKAKIEGADILTESAFNSGLSKGIRVVKKYFEK